MKPEGENAVARCPRSRDRLINKISGLMMGRGRHRSGLKDDLRTATEGGLAVAAIPTIDRNSQLVTPTAGHEQSST